MKKQILSSSYEARRHRLEDAFFSSRDAKLLEQLQLMEKMKESKEALRKVSNIKSEAVLEKLVALDVRPETLVSLAIVPLVEIAWADGKIDEKEQEAMLKAVVDAGFNKSSVHYAVIESWMTHRPPAKLLAAWLHYTKGLCESLTEKEKKDFCKKIVDRATAIAESSGGFLGLGNKISKAEQKVIDSLKTAFE
jgi:tellurite resistance protein